MFDWNISMNWEPRFKALVEVTEAVTALRVQTLRLLLALSRWTTLRNTPT